MKNVSLSSILLFSLAVYFIMQNRLSPGDTPFLLFGFIFLLLLGNVVIDFLSLSQKLYQNIKDLLLWVTIVVVLGAGFFASLIVRHQTAPVYGVNDIVVQQEAAIRYFVHGKNPYKETYFGTPVETFHYSDTAINPALYHFVMEPGYLLIPLPFYTLSNHLIGYFDSREVLWLLFGGMLLLAYAIPQKREDKRMFVTLLAFNPATLSYVLEGRSDVFAYFFLLLTFFLLEKKRFFWSSLLLAVSFLIKQSAWPLLPLYGVYLLRYAWYEKGLANKLTFLIKNFVGFVVLFLGVSAPFYFWSPAAYIASTISYLSGATAHSYPVSGYGFGMILNQLGIIKDVNAYYPFTLWQIGIGLPILGVLSWYLWKKPTVQKLILFYAIFLFVFWYFSRYFNNSHVGYISMVLITGYFWRQEN